MIRALVFVIAVTTPLLFVFVLGPALFRWLFPGVMP